MGGSAEFFGAWRPPFADFLRLGGVVGYASNPTLSSDPLSMVRLGADISMPIALAGPLSLELGGGGGYNLGLYGGSLGGYPWLGARSAIMFRFSPSFGLGLGASYKEVFGLYRGVDIALGVSFSPGAEARSAKLEFAATDLRPVYPVFYKYYDQNPVGTVVLRNAESGDISDLRVTLFVKSYMDSPKTCGAVARLAKGESVAVPLLALFNQSILGVTEGTKASAELEVRYRLGREELVSRQTVSLDVLYRNALTWDDDRKAASFVTAKDPAILGFAKNIAGSVREADASGYILQFRQALAIFETLSVYGMNYVVDPASSYAKLSGEGSSLDYLQFPGQSLTYRAGDCDDLTVLYCALLESAGIESAFITVPGHIYAAFSPAIDPQAASRYFASANDYIAKDGRLWVPVEITMIHGGFLKAWQEGLRQWHEASMAGTAALFPVREAWKFYEPSASSEDARIVAPDKSRIMERYDESWKKYVLFEISAREKTLKEALAKKDDPITRNRLGILYASYSLFDQAEIQFVAGARHGDLSCIVNLANLYFLRGDWAGAYDGYQRALKISPKNVLALLGAARAEYERENYASARSLYNELKALSPEAAQGCAYIISGASAEARAAAADDRTRIEWGE